MQAQFYILPLVSGFLYAFGSIWLKRALGEGLDHWRLTIYSNIAMALLFQPFWLLGGHPVGWERWYQPVVLAVLFVAGQVCTFLSLVKGDVTVATPLLGAKSAFVAVFTVVLLRLRVPLPWWIAAGVVILALALLRGRRHETAARRAFLPTVLAALGAAVTFALTDVGFQHWAPDWGVGYITPVFFACTAVIGLAVLPMVQGRPWHVPVAARPWLCRGLVFYSLQAVGMAYAIAVLGNATGLNILYSSRGVWTVVLVWLLGATLGNAERDQGHGVMARRLIGAGLMVAAIVLVALGKPT